jgi:uncharacterized protein YciI
MSDTVSNHERLEKLRSKQLNKRLYTILWINTAGSTREQHLEILPDHLEFLLDLEQRGILFASGPLSVSEGGDLPFNGMTMLRADGFDEARSIVDREPFVMAGLRSYRLYAWQLNEGSFTVNLSFATGTFTVP